MIAVISPPMRAMLRLAFVGATIIATQQLLHSGVAHAQDLALRQDRVFLPACGFRFEMQRRSDLDYLKENRDPKTGQRLPEIDAGSMRTWSLEEPEFTLPEQGKHDIDAGSRRTRALEEPEIVWPDNLGRELEFVLPEDTQIEPEDEGPGAEPQPSG